jgi:hypothetical protein
MNMRFIRPLAAVATGRRIPHITSQDLISATSRTNVVAEQEAVVR